MPNIITHNGPCDASSVVATILIELAHDEVARVERVGELTDHIDPNTYVVGIGRKSAAKWYDYDKKDPHHLFHAFPLGPCGLAWLDLGATILERLGLDDEAVDDVATKAYIDFFAGIDAHYHRVKHLPTPPVQINFKQPLSLPFCINQINHMADDYDVAFAATTGAIKPMVEGYLQRLVSETTAYLADAEMIQRAHAAAYADLENQGYLVLDRYSSQANRYLRQNDPLQYFKMVIMPSKDNQQWMVHTVDYRRQQYNTYVRIADDVAGSVSIHRNRHRAECATLKDAVTAVKQSLDAYYAWENLPNRVWRYWAC